MHFLLVLRVSITWFVCLCLSATYSPDIKQSINFVFHRGSQLSAAISADMPSADAKAISAMHVYHQLLLILLAPCQPLLLLGLS